MVRILKDTSVWNMKRYVGYFIFFKRVRIVLTKQIISLNREQK